MFKANIIEDTNYYKGRRSNFLWMVGSCLLIGILVNLFKLPVWVMVFFVLGYIGVQVLRNKNIDKIRNASSHRSIEIDEAEIRILNGNGVIETKYLIADLNDVKTNYDFSMPFETLESMKEEVRGNFSKNFLSFSHLKEEKRYEFELPSYYMIVQLKKLLEVWEEKGCEVNQA